jgi:ribosomal protein S30
MGSLCRAGKVVLQTPEVTCRLPKPKQPKGRASKRKAFNQRFTHGSHIERVRNSNLRSGDVVL